MADESTINLLTNVKTAKVSLVKRGANKRRFALFKSEQEMDPEFQEILEAIMEIEAENEDQIEEIFKQDKLTSKEINAVKGVLRMVSGFKDKLPKDVMSKLAALAGYPTPAKKQKKTPEEIEGEKKKEKEKAKKQKDKEKEKDKYGYPMMKALESLPEERRDELEPIVKALDEAYAEQIEKADAERKDAEKETAEIKKALKDERDTRQLQEWIAKADTDLSHYPGASAEELGAQLKKLHDVDADFAEKEFERMKAASEALKQSDLLKEAGGNRAPTGSAYQKIQELTKAKIQKSAGEMTEEQAEVEIMNEHPALYEKYLEENPAQSRPIMA